MSNQLQKEYDERIAELYKKGVEDLEPPEYLDRYVLYESQRQHNVSPIKRFMHHWAAPTSMAAVVLLSVVLVININDETSIESLESERLKQVDATIATPVEDAQMPGANQGIILKDTIKEAERRKKAQTAQRSNPVSSKASLAVTPQKKLVTEQNSPSKKPIVVKKNQTDILVKPATSKPKEIPVIKRAISEPEPIIQKLEEPVSFTPEPEAPISADTNSQFSAGTSSSTAKGKTLASPSRATTVTPETQSAHPIPEQALEIIDEAESTVTKSVTTKTSTTKPETIATPQYDIPTVPTEIVKEKPADKEINKTIIGSALEDPSDPEVLLKKQKNKQSEKPVSGKPSQISKSDFERQVEKQDTQQLQKIQQELKVAQSPSLLPKPSLMADPQQWFKLIVDLYDKPLEKQRYIANVKAFKARHSTFELDKKMKILFPKYKAP